MGRRWPLIFLALAVGSLVAFGGLVWLSLARLQPRAIPPEALAGKRVWESQGCVECHTVLGNGGYNGGDVTGVASRRGRLWLLEFLTEPPLLSPNRQRRHPGLDAVEAWQVVDYLEFLDRIETPAWPPPLPRRPLPGPEGR